MTVTELKTKDSTQQSLPKLIKVEVLVEEPYLDLLLEAISQHTSYDKIYYEVQQ